LRIPAVWTTNLVALLVGFVIFRDDIPTAVSSDSSGGRLRLRASVTKFGVFLLPMTVMMFFAGMTAGRLSGRIGAKSVLAIGAPCLRCPRVCSPSGTTSSGRFTSLPGWPGSASGWLFSAIRDRVTIVSPEPTGVPAA